MFWLKRRYRTWIYLQSLCTILSNYSSSYSHVSTRYWDCSPYLSTCVDSHSNPNVFRLLHPTLRLNMSCTNAGQCFLGFFYTPVLFSTPVKCHNDVNDIWLCCFKMKRIRQIQVCCHGLSEKIRVRYNIVYKHCHFEYMNNLWIGHFFYNIFETFQNVKQLIYEQLLYLREIGKCIVSVITSSEAITIFLDWDSIKPQWCTVVLRLCNKCTQKTLKNVYTTVTVGFSSNQHSRWWCQWVIYSNINTIQIHAT